jgi:hypothetical protein
MGKMQLWSEIPVRKSVRDRKSLNARVHACWGMIKDQSKAAHKAF